MAFDYLKNLMSKKDLGYKAYEDHIEVSAFNDHKKKKIVLGAEGYLLAERYNGVFTLPEKIDNKPVTVISGFYDSLGLINARGPYYGFGGENLCQIVLPDTITEIGDGAFAHCTNLRDISIPQRVTRIGKYAFAFCSSLPTVSIPSSVESIEEFCFDSCRELSSIQMGTGIKTIKEQAFSECEKLNSIELPDGITKIEMGAFQGCRSLRSIVLPKSLMELDSFAFANCDKLESVTIPGTVSRIASHAFKESPIKDVFFCGTEAEWNSLMDRTKVYFKTYTTIHFGA